MTYTVIWRTAAEEEFKRLWDQSDDPGMILNAARKIEARLQRSAHQVGESRENDEFRIVFESPLGVAFWVSELDQISAVNAVWRTD